MRRSLTVRRPGLLLRWRLAGRRLGARGRGWHQHGHRLSVRSSSRRSR